MSATSQSVKIKFVGFLKGLFGGSDNAGEVSDQTEIIHEPLAMPPQMAPAPAARPMPTANGQNHYHNGNGNGGSALQLPLQSVICAMQPELRARVRQAVPDDLTIAIAYEKVLPQLSTGMVKIPFGTIRQSVPHIFAGSADSDHLTVILPLGEILPRINPALLTRRQGQKQVVVSEEISGPFGANGQGAMVSNEAPKPAPAAPHPQPRPLPRSAPTSPVPMPSQAPSLAATFARQQISPATSPAPIMPVAPRPIPPVIPPPAPIPMTSAAPALTPLATPGAPTFTHSRPMQMSPGAHVNPINARPVVRVVPPTPVVTPTPAAAPAPIAAMPAPVAIPAAPPLNAPLAALAEGWPGALRQEIAQLHLEAAQIALPIEAVETGLKRGRVAFPWKTLRSWIQPAPLPAVSANDDMELELPLKVLAPLFISRQRNGAKLPNRVDVDEGIPNLFFGFPTPATAPTLAPAPAPAPVQALAPDAVPFAFTVSPNAPVAPVKHETDILTFKPPTPTPAAIVTSAPVPALPGQVKPADTNYYVWSETSDSARVDETEFKRKPAGTGTDFVVRYATPNEIVSRAAALDGVAGALIALPDGLMVANRIPTDLNGDTLAAFLPQLFTKMSQCTKELRMGELNNLNFTVGNIPWKIFRVNAVFFAAFGRAGQGLPTAQLAALAGELDRKNR